jgi:site-specific DNA-methyltransferase (adenine-specific)
MLLLNGDCIEEMQKMIDEGVQVDSVVTDPPYELGFMGKSWDSTGIAFQKETWELAYQLLKPGGHLLAFSSSRTYHRMAVAIEDSGFNIRDQIMWLYGSGFPKSLNIGKAIDKKLGAKRKVVGQKTAGALSGNSKFNDAKTGTISRNHSNPTQSYKSGKAGMYDVTEPTTPEAKQHEGWGTAIKPAHEPIVMARKPFEGTVADNVLKHGTGGINIDGCRISTEDKTQRKNKGVEWGVRNDKSGNESNVYDSTEGRFPANVMHDGIEEDWARYFYCPKVSKAERNKGLDHLPTKKTSSMSGRRDPHDMEKSKIDNDVTGRFVTERKNVHPTVKPQELMKYLCRLVTPKDGTVLDPFMGSGSTGMAAKDEGFDFIGIEQEKEYFEIADSRINITAPLSEFFE